MSVQENKQLAAKTETRPVTQIRSATVVKPRSLKLTFKWVKVKVIKCYFRTNVVVNELYDLIITIPIAYNHSYSQTIDRFTDCLQGH